MITTSNFGLVIIIECVDSYTFANELDSVLQHNPNIDKVISCDAGKYTAVLTKGKNNG